MPASASARRARMIRCGKQGNCFYPGRRQGFGSGAVHHEDQKLEQDCRSEAQVCHEEGLLVHIQGSYQSDMESVINHFNGSPIEHERKET
ncbi:hypothetical protein LINPERHAP1_LOCUS17648, partial [Linum perenne]